MRFFWKKMRSSSGSVPKTSEPMSVESLLAAIEQGEPGPILSGPDEDRANKDAQRRRVQELIGHGESVI